MTEQGEGAMHTTEDVICNHFIYPPSPFAGLQLHKGLKSFLMYFLIESDPVAAEIVLNENCNHDYAG